MCATRTFRSIDAYAQGAYAYAFVAYIYAASPRIYCRPSSKRPSKKPYRLLATLVVYPACCRAVSTRGSALRSGFFVPRVWLRQTARTKSRIDGLAGAGPEQNAQRATPAGHFARAAFPYGKAALILGSRHGSGFGPEAQSPAPNPHQFEQLSGFARLVQMVRVEIVASSAFGLRRQNRPRSVGLPRLGRLSPPKSRSASTLIGAS